ncbi:helix-turn-helix transcriptional regulator, partial [Thomasclavelia ramosa]
MLVFLLLDNLSKKRIGYLEVKDSKYKDRITKIIKYLENNYQEDLSVKMIADEFGLSEGYLSKLFKESLGATVKEYLSRVRLWHAEEQLVETDYPVIDIAIGNGFPNVKSFNQAFKRKNVITPAKYREKMRK